MRRDVRHPLDETPAERQAKAQLTHLCAGQDLVGYLNVRIHVPYFVQVLERAQQLHHLLGTLPGELKRGGGPLRHFRSRRRKAVVGEHGAHGVELERVRQHLDAVIGARHHVLGTRLERHAHQRLFVRAGRVGHEPHGIEQVAHRTMRPEVAAVLGEGAPHLVGHTAEILRQAIHHDRCPAGAVALVAHPLAALGRARPLAAAPAQLRALAALDVSPLAVSCHARRPRQNQAGMIAVILRGQHVAQHACLPEPP